MQVNNDTAAWSATAAQAGAPEMGHEEFLKLLVTQLRHQDPLSPMDNTAFVSQLAEFSALEQMQMVNTNMESQMELIQGNSNQATAALIGKDILAYGNSIDVSVSGQSNDLVMELAAAGNATITVLDSAGNPVRTITADDLDSGRNKVSWDGLDNHGQEVPAGDYTFTVNASNNAGDPIATQTYTAGTVTGIRYGGGGAVLLLGDDVVLLSDVLEINEPGSTGPDANEGA